MKLLLLMVSLLATTAAANDFTHCGPQGFSPPAPPEICNQMPHNTVPEPGTWLLAAGGLLALRVGLRRRHG